MDGGKTCGRGVECADRRPEYASGLTFRHCVTSRRIGRPMGGCCDWSLPTPSLCVCPPSLQALRYEPADRSPSAEFLIERAKTNPECAVMLHWWELQNGGGGRH